MQIQAFKVFRDLVETASFSHAAALNEITQSAVSQQIRSIERQFKTLLIERGKKNFSLTPEGLAFLEASREILNIYTGLGARISELQNIVAGPLRIATVYSIGLHELPPYLKRFRMLFPEVDARVEYRRAAQVYSEVLSGAVDLGLVAFPVRRKGIIVESFWRDKLVLVCSPGHPLADRRRVRFRDLEGDKFISFEPDQPTTKAINRRLQEAGVAVRAVMEFDNIETVKRAVEIEGALSIVPSATVSDEVRDGHLVMIEFDEPDMFRPIAVLTKRNRAISPAHKRFVALLKENLVGVGRFGEGPQGDPAGAAQPGVTEQTAVPARVQKRKAAPAPARTKKPAPPGKAAKRARTTP